MNVIVEKNDTFNWFKDIQDDVVYLPIMWLDEGISGPSKVRFIIFKKKTIHNKYFGKN